MRNLFLLVCLFLVSCTDSNQTSNNGNTCSSFTESEGVISMENSYFQSLKNGMILSINSSETIGVEHTISDYSISPVFPKDYDGKWKLDFKGDGFQTFGNTLISSQKIANDDKLFSLYNLYTGSKVIEYTYDKFEVLFSDENEKRFLGFYSRNGAEVDNADYKFGENTFGYLNYSNTEGKINSIRINAADPMWMEIFDLTNPVIDLMPLNSSAIVLNSGKTLYFTSSDGKLGEEVNFDIQFTYYTLDTYKPTSFILELRGDEIIVPDDFSNTVFNLESL